MHDRHSFFGHAVSFLLAFVGDPGDDEPECEAAEPVVGFVARIARLIAATPGAHTTELVGVVAGVLVDAGAARDVA